MNVRLGARAEYALRAMGELARAPAGQPVSGRGIARSLGISPKFLLNILGELRRDGLVVSHRGAMGGFSLAGPPGEITVGEVLAAVDRQWASGEGSRAPERCGAVERLLSSFDDQLHTTLDRLTLMDLAVEPA